MPLKSLKTKNRLENIKRNPKRAYLFAKNILKKRWPQAEPYIMKDGFWAYKYANDVMKELWPEAESSINKDKLASYFYHHLKMKMKK